MCHKASSGKYERGEKMINIRKLKTTNHPILKNIELDFMRPDGTCYNTIILAGENGSGKTTIFDVFTNLIIHPFGAGGGMGVDGFDLEIEIKHNDDKNYVFKKVPGENYYSWQDMRGRHVSNEGSRRTNINILRSDVEINFEHEEINAITARNLDATDKNGLIKTPKNLATEIAHLLIDIDGLDSIDVVQWVDASGNEGKPVPESERHKRIKRFRNAFEVMFHDKLNFSKINNRNNKKEIIFNKKVNGAIEEVILNKLSSGEKQVVFRSAFLLKDKNSLSGCIVLIDEPELSMHPKWEEKLLSFLQTLFKNDIGTQTSQLFIATHSEHVLKSALEDDNSLIVKLRENEPPETIFKGQTGNSLRTVTLGEVKWRVFDMPTVDYHIELYAWLHKLSGVGSCGDFKNWLRANHPLSIGTLPVTTYRGYTDETLPTYIRNYIDHPDECNRSSDCLNRLEDSINHLRRIIATFP